MATRHNDCINPYLKAGITGWFTTDGVRVTTATGLDTAAGDSAGRTTSWQAPAGGGTVVLPNVNGAGLGGTLRNHTVYAKASDAGCTATLSLQSYYDDGTATFRGGHDGTAVGLTAGAWVRIGHSATLRAADDPNPGDPAANQCRTVVTTTGTGTIQFSLALFEGETSLAEVPAPPGSYFDGDSPDAAWNSGTDGASTLTITDPPTAVGYPAIVQGAEALSPARPATTTVGTLGTAATAGNLIVMVVAGDKNTGALTVADNTATGTWMVGNTNAVELTAPQTSLYIAWKEAVGGETTVTATHGSAAQGNTGWIAEISQEGTAAWAVVARATNNSTNVAISSVATGTTGAATYNGLAFAAASVDSITSIRGGTLSWSPAAPTYTSRYAAPFDGVSGSGGGSGGAYVATGEVTQGATTSATHSTTSGSDERSGAVLVFGRQGTADTEVNGTATAALGGLTATATGIRSTSGTAAAPLGALTATATAVRDTAGTATAALGGLTAAATGTRSTDGTAVAPLGDLTATAVGAHVYDGTATATLGGLTATATAGVAHPATAAAALGALTATATGVRSATGTAVAPLGELAATAAGVVTPPGAGAGTAPLGGLTATATGERATFGAATALLSGLSATATGTVSRTGTATALLGGLTATATDGASTGTEPGRFFLAY